jgi:hypothetical protein
LYETINAIQQKQEATLNDIQLKLIEMNQVKDHLMSTNEFKPNLSLFDQKEETSLFGSIKLNSFWLNMNLFKSQIIKGERQMSELIKVYVNSHQMTNGLCCIVEQEMALVQMTFIQNVMVMRIR